MRVLGRTRISRSTEESTSIDRQRELIQNWADTHDHTIVGWAEDIDVSGSVDPFYTPELGPWLTPEKQGEWDILCSWKMDRLARRTVPLHKLFGWVQDHEKVLVCISDNIDLSTWVGRLVASVIAGVAEGELESIRERSAASQRKLREVGRYGGGRLPYGYRPAPLDSGGWTLEHDPEQAKVIRRMVELALDGESGYGIAAELNSAGVKSPAGTTWSRETVNRVLRSRTIMGWTTHQGYTVRDSTGAPVLKGPPIIELPVFSELQQALDKRKTTPSKSRTLNPLLGIAKCADCGKNLYYRQKNVNRGKGNYRYFHCSNECGPYMNGEVLIQQTHDWFIENLGDLERLEKIVRYPVDHSDRILEIEEAIEELAKMLGSIGSSTAIQAMSAQLESLDAELQELEAEHSADGTVEWIPTGETYGTGWDQLDMEQRRELIQRSGMVVNARCGIPGTRGKPGTVEAHFILPPDIQERLA